MSLMSKGYGRSSAWWRLLAQGVLHAIWRSAYAIRRGVFYVGTFETSLGIAHIIFRHLLVTTEISTLQGTFRRDKPAILIAPQLVLILIPEEFFAGEAQAILGKNPHPTSQLPLVELVIIIRGVCLDITIDMQFLVKLLQKSPLSKVHREMRLAWFTSQRSATMRYLMTPESLMSVFTP